MKKRKVSVYMLELITMFLLIVFLTAGLSYTAGVFTGRAYERKQIITILDRYYSESYDDIKQSIKEDDKNDHQR